MTIGILDVGCGSALTTVKMGVSKAPGCRRGEPVIVPMRAVEETVRVERYIFGRLVLMSEKSGFCSAMKRLRVSSSLMKRIEHVQIDYGEVGAF